MDEKAKGLGSRVGGHGIAFVTCAAGLKSTRFFKHSLLYLEEDIFIEEKIGQKRFPVRNF